MIKIIKGEDKDIVVRLTSKVTNDPLDINGVSMIRACFKGETTDIHEYYLALSGDFAGGTDLISNIETSFIVEGMPVIGEGVPDDTVILKTPLSLVDPTDVNTVRLSRAVNLDGTQKALSVGTIKILGALIGKILIAIPSSDTSQLYSGDEEGFEIMVVKNKRKSYVQFEESLIVLEGLC